MRHRMAGRKLGRNASHRKALFRNMVTSLFEHQRIQTTDAKAKEVRRIAEKLITLGKRGDLHARRQALAYVRDKDVVAKLFGEIAPRYADRPGGYTRIVKVGYRRGDNAPVSFLELVQEAYQPRSPKKKARPAKSKEKAAAGKSPPKPEVDVAATEPESAAEPAAPEAVVEAADPAADVDAGQEGEKTE